MGVEEADALRFFERLKTVEPELGPRFAELEKGLTGTQEEKHARMQALIRAELEQLAVETMGEPGRALVEAIENEFGD